MSLASLTMQTTSELRCSVRPSTWSKMLASVLRTLASRFGFAAAARKPLEDTVSWREPLRVYPPLILSSVFDIGKAFTRARPRSHKKA